MLGWSFGMSGSHLGATGVIFWRSEDHLEAFCVLLDPLWRSLSWLGGHFVDSSVAFVENM